MVTGDTRDIVDHTYRVPGHCSHLWRYKGIVDHSYDWVSENISLTVCSLCHILSPSWKHSDAVNPWQGTAHKSMSTLTLTSTNWYSNKSCRHCFRKLKITQELIVLSTNFYYHWNRKKIIYNISEQVNFANQGNLAKFAKISCSRKFPDLQYTILIY